LNPIPSTLASLIDVAINRYLGLDTTAKSAVSRLSGKSIEIRLSDAGVFFFLCPEQDHMTVVNHYDGDADTTMTASILTLARLGLGIADDGADSLFSGDVEITGDASLGQQFHNLLKNVQIDWEEIISNYTGDIVAHQIGNSIRTLSRWGKNTVATLSLDTTEYLQEESHQLPSTWEMQTFLSNIDAIRIDVDRAEAKTKRLLALNDQFDSSQGDTQHSEPSIENIKTAETSSRANDS